MNFIHFDRLSEPEQLMHQKIASHVSKNTTLTITQAAQLCECSASKISKFVKKIGFKNFKHYLQFLSGKPAAAAEASENLTRTISFIENLDQALVHNFVDMLQGYNRIILFGYGSSFICAQYFEYTLRTVVNKIVVAAPDEYSVARLLQEETLLIIFSATGTFTSFTGLQDNAKHKGAQCLLVVEEYNPALLNTYTNILFLTNTLQPSTLKPYEKSRAIFFIFIEEVLQTLRA